MPQKGAGAEHLNPGRLSPAPWDSLERTSPSMVALGNFDGVHLGHARILDALVSESRASDLEPVLVTFEPHPRFFFKPQERTSLLTTPGEKMALLAKWPVEVVALAFDASLAGLPAEDFIDDFLKRRLKAVRFLLGHDHRFGKGAMGNAALLKTKVAHPDRDVLLLEPLRLEGEVVSSSAIRGHLRAGRMVEANRLLGRRFAYAGPVIHGQGRGRLLGFPTANIDIGDSHRAVVAHGVYGGWARVEGTLHPAIANIGTNPTFHGQALKIEVHLLSGGRDLYGSHLEFQMEFFLRPEMKFSEVGALAAQIKRDIERVKTALT